MSWKPGPQSKATDAFNKKWSHTYIFLQFLINNQGSEESKKRKVLYDSNDFNTTCVTLVQSDFVNVHEKSSDTSNLVKTAGGF